MKDYVMMVDNLTEFMKGPIEEADGISIFSLSTTPLVKKDGKAVAITRLNKKEYDWLTGLAGITELGVGTPLIKEPEDVKWSESGQAEYNKIHSTIPYEVDDGEGGTTAITPPALHCVLAS